MFGPWALIEQGERLFQPLDVGFCLLKMFFDRGTQRVASSAFGHLRQRFDELFFGTEQVFEFMQEASYRAIRVSW